MNYLIVFVQFGILVPINADYDLKCPSAGQWRLRAQSYCPREEMYTCLKFIDPDMPYEQKYTETCKGPRKESPGDKPIINSGNFENVDCSEDRYQPILFSTTKGSNCLYLKSNCNEEGQFIYSNGSTKQDRTCGCNYVEQYVFLSQNHGHPCYCRPSVEDCTCYKKACDSGFRLSPDYKCVPDNETSGRYNCKEIVTLEKDKVNLTKNGFEEDELEGRNRDLAFIYTVPLYVLVMFGFLWMVLFLKRIQIYDRYILCTTKDDKIKRDAYLDDIKKKTEKRFYIRVMIVGEHGVGKSCLLRRLLGEGIEGVESTDGIDIVVRRCKIRLSDGKWIFDADQDPKRKYAARIKRAIAQETLEQETRAIVKQNVEYEEKAMEMNTFDKNTEHSAHNEETTEQQEEVQITVTAEDKLSGHQPQTFVSEQKTNTTHKRETGDFTSTRKVTKVLTDDVEQELEHFLSSIDKYENENETYVEIAFWDFAGEKDYYGTHYTFLDSHALYLLVTDCSVDIKQTKPGDTYDSIGSYIDFWFDTIHNCRDVEEENTDKHLNPPIIAVCTGLDKLTEKVNDKKDTYLQNLKDAIQDGQKRHHLGDVCFVSNTKQSGSEFDHVRELIFKWGQQLQSFGKMLPLKWIRLEQSLDVVREGGFNIIAREDVIDLAKKCDIHETKEVEQFLKHQHKMGSIIYCDDINKYVILKQKWLADAFKCLVSDKIENTIKMSDEWETLSKTGILEITLITRLFQKEPKFEFSKYEDHIMQVLIKFDIVGINVEKEKDIYYMPYMIRSSTSLSEIVDHFGVSNARKTPWLCYEFDFLPIPFFTYVMLYFIRSYKMCFDTKLNKQSIYHGVGVFLLDQTRDLKFIVLFCKNTVAFQIWHWVDFPKERYQTSLFEFQKVIDNLKRKYEAKNLRDYVKVKCSEGDVNSKVGRMSYRDILDESNSGKYFCDECNRTHDSNKLLDTWFFNYSNDKEMNSNTDTNRDTESFDSVRCQLCVSDPRTAVYWCTECVQAMCRECTTVHRTQPTSSTHTTVLLTHDYNFQIKGIIISDITSLCEGVLVINDYNGNQLITCDIRGHNRQFIPLPYRPWRLSVIDQNNVAVTAYDDKKVLIVDVTQKNITKQFDIEKECLGIMYRDNHLYVSCNKSLVKVDMSGEIIRTVPLSFTPWYICSGTEGRIYCTALLSYTVYCIDTEGNTVFTVTNPDMSSPWGITTDNEGHVLVVCRVSNIVHRISPDGKQCNVIIKDIPSNNLRFSYICYDSISKSIVISRGDTVYVYKI